MRSFVCLRFQVVGNVMPFADITVLASMCARRILSRTQTRAGADPTVAANHTVRHGTGPHRFASIDKGRRGRVSWDEYIGFLELTAPDSTLNAIRNVRRRRVHRCPCRCHAMGSVCVTAHGIRRIPFP